MAVAAPPPPVVETPSCEAATDAADGLFMISELVLPWTDVAGVGALAQASKPWLSETSCQVLWRDFVVARWRVVPKHAPRVYGAPTWQLVSRAGCLLKGSSGGLVG